MNFIEKKNIHNKLCGVTHIESDRKLLARYEPTSPLLKSLLFNVDRVASDVLWKLLDYASEEEIIGNRRLLAMTDEDIQRQQEEALAAEWAALIDQDMAEREEQLVAEQAALIAHQEREAQLQQGDDSSQDQEAPDQISDDAQKAKDIVAQAEQDAEDIRSEAEEEASAIIEAAEEEASATAEKKSTSKKKSSQK